MVKTSFDKLVLGFENRTDKKTHNCVLCDYPMTKDDFDKYGGTCFSCNKEGNFI